MSTQTKLSYTQQVINGLIPAIKDQGFRVFIAESGRYGFFTDTEGTRVISFQVDYLSPTFSGNYTTNKPQQTGTGWRISDSDTGDYQSIFNAYPEHWAVGDSAWHFTTLADHLKTYQRSSRYQEV